MKKIISFLFALILISFANAQTVENKGVFSQMYIGASGGLNYTEFQGLNNIGYNAAIELGKNVTPITGFSLQGVMKPDSAGLQHTEVFGNTKFNLMNLFGGYKGKPRFFEIQTVTGIGWNHNYNSVNPNDLSLQCGLEFDFNLGKNRNWYITFTPMLQANQILKGDEITYMINHSDVKANFGVTYRFGCGKESHNFTLCPYTYTEDQYDELCASYDECINRPPQIDTIIIEKPIEKIVEVEKYITITDNEGLNFVKFDKGSSKVEGLGQEMLDYIISHLPKDADIEVIGSADSGTGSLEFNQQLASERANVIANELKNNGFNNVTISTALDKLGTTEMSRCAVIVK
jgi:hypothetical protein